MNESHPHPSLATYRRRDLLALPSLDRKSGEHSRGYDSMIVVPKAMKPTKGSEYPLMAVIGMRERFPVGIVAYADDIQWRVTAGVTLRTENLSRSKCLHFWSEDHARFYPGGRGTGLMIEVRTAGRKARD